MAGADGVEAGETRRPVIGRDWICRFPLPSPPSDFFPSAKSDFEDARVIVSISPKPLSVKIVGQVLYIPCT